MREQYAGSTKFGNSPMCEYVYNVTLDDLADEMLSNEPDGGWAQRVGKRILEGDSQGFVYLTKLSSVAEAEAKMAELAADPYYADDDEVEPWEESETFMGGNQHI